jgi:hypothetical protein
MKTCCFDQNFIITLFFIKGYIIEKVVNCILMDDGLTVNILPLKTMNEIGIPRDELFSIHLTIQGFNQEGKNIIGNIRLVIHMKDIEFKLFFHIIDVKTTYNMLLGQPWIHKTYIVSSTFH